jgi:hypothetical protein
MEDVTDASFNLGWPLGWPGLIWGAWPPGPPPLRTASDNEYFYVYARNLHGSRKAVEVGDLRAEDKVTELGKRQKDYEKHDGESEQVFCRGAESRRQLGHSLVETDVLEDLWQTALLGALYIMHS